MRTVMDMVVGVIECAAETAGTSAVLSEFEYPGMASAAFRFMATDGIRSEALGIVMVDTDMVRVFPANGHLEPFVDTVDTETEKVRHIDRLSVKCPVTDLTPLREASAAAFCVAAKSIREARKAGE